MRAYLLALFTCGAIGTAAELLLLDHTESRPQWIPLTLIALSLLGLVGRAVHPGSWTTRLFQGIMVLFICGGFLGLWLHYSGNMEFELEMYPERSGLPLVWRSLRGATPALAPGTMILLGMIGLLTTDHRPVTNTDSEGA